MSYLRNVRPTLVKFKNPTLRRGANTLPAHLVIKGVPKKMMLGDFLTFFIAVHSILKPVS